MKGMKSYIIYFIIKKNNHGYLNEIQIEAVSKKEAIIKTKKMVMENSGKHAFACTNRKPVKTKTGLEFNGMIYPKYSELFHMLY